PYCMEINDIPLFIRKGYTGEQYLRSVLDQFEQLYADSEKQPRVMGIPLHPMIIGQPLRIKYLQQALAEMKKHERVWFATGGEIIDAYEQGNRTGWARARHTGRTTYGSSWEETMKLLSIAAATCFLVASGGAAVAQQAKSLKDQLVGTWTFVVAEVTAPDGKKSFPFGETPKGILIFTPDGHFAQIHVASDVPKIASNNRLTGTADEYATIMRRSISVFGTYTVDEDKKTVTYHIASSSFPNWE